MSSQSEQTSRVVATIQEVLPRLGLAYALDEGGRCWGITRAAAAQALATLKQGDKVTLVVEQHAGFAIASACLPLQPQA